MRQQVLISSDIPNKNGRIYPKELLQKLVTVINENKDSNFGELGHPTDFKSAVNLRNVSHEYSEATVNKNILEVEIKLLDTTNGKILQTNLDKFVFRTRGSRTIDENGIVQNDYKLITIDATLKENDAFINLLINPNE